jgi:hypothetical protein
VNSLSTSLSTSNRLAARRARGGVDTEPIAAIRSAERPGTISGTGSAQTRPIPTAARTARDLHRRCPRNAVPVTPQRTANGCRNGRAPANGQSLSRCCSTVWTSRSSAAPLTHLSLAGGCGPFASTWRRGWPQAIAALTTSRIIEQLEPAACPIRQRHANSRSACGDDDHTLTVDGAIYPWHAHER